MISKICAREACGKQFETRFTRQRYCCYDCGILDSSPNYVKTERKKIKKAYIPRIPKTAICPDCGAEFPKMGNQKRCAKCSTADRNRNEIARYRKFQEENGIEDVPLEVSQMKILTCHNGVEVLNNPFGQMMFRGDKTEKEIAEGMMITVEELKQRRSERSYLCQRNKNIITTIAC